MFNLFSRRYPRLIFKGRDLIVFSVSESKKTTIRYELGSDVVYIYFGGLDRWDNFEKISEQERSYIKFHIEELRPKHWNIAWVSAPSFGV